MLLVYLLWLGHFISHSPALCFRNWDSCHMGYPGSQSFSLRLIILLVFIGPQFADIELSKVLSLHNHVSQFLMINLSACLPVCLSIYLSSPTVSVPLNNSNANIHLWFKHFMTMKCLTKKKNRGCIESHLQLPYFPALTHCILGI